MKKILLIIFVLLILGGLGYVGYKHFWPGSKNQSGGPAGAAQLCDIDSQTCSAIEKGANSGTLQVTITASGKAVSDLEVDVGTKPGAQKYYLKLTDSSGIALFEGIPAGSYSVYFNGNNFPKQFGDSPLVLVEISVGQTTQKSIDLNSK